MSGQWEHLSTAAHAKYRKGQGKHEVIVPPPPPRKAKPAPPARALLTLGEAELAAELAAVVRRLDQSMEFFGSNRQPEVYCAAREAELLRDDPALLARANTTFLAVLARYEALTDERRRRDAAIVPEEF